jgi:hypothetical protein
MAYSSTLNMEVMSLQQSSKLRGVTSQELHLSSDMTGIYFLYSLLSNLPANKNLQMNEGSLVSAVITMTVVWLRQRDAAILHCRA